MKSKFLVLTGLLMVASMVLAACQPQAAGETVIQTVIVEGTPHVVEVTAQAPQAPAGPKILSIGTGISGDVPTLDPAIAEDTNSITFVESTFIGLTHLHEETNALEPGMASEWESVINDDGTETITFYLRDDVPWVRWNGEEVETVKTCDGSADRIVNAHDFAYGIYRNLLPANASPYAFLMGFVLKGAADFNNGKTEDFSTVGIEVVDDFTIKMTFMTPVAYNAAIAGLWVARPQPKWVIEGDCEGAVEAQADRWTEAGFFQSFGPYTLKEWVHDSSIVMVKNPFWPGTDNIPQAKIDEVRFVMLDQQPTFAEYEAGNIDYAAVPQADIDRVKADPVLSKELKIFPKLCTYYYGFNTTAPVVNDVRVRRALSMALDRQSLIDNVTKGNQQPAQWFARPSLAGAPTMEDHPDLGVKYDPTAAKALLDEYLGEKDLAANQLDLTLLYNTDSGHQRIAETIQQMWADTLGVNVKLINQESAVFWDTIKSADTPQIYRAGWCPDYPDANNFTREVFASGGSQNPTDENGNPSGGEFWKNEDFEKLVIDAVLEKDPVKRVELYAQAEQILVWEDAVIIPIHWYTNVQVTKPYVTRTYSVGGHELFYKWDINK